jgi:hypothetical protein
MHAFGPVYATPAADCLDQLSFAGLPAHRLYQWVWVAVAFDPYAAPIPHPDAALDAVEPAVSNNGRQRPCRWAMMVLICETNRRNLTPTCTR